MLKIMAKIRISEELKREEKSQPKKIMKIKNKLIKSHVL
jgi:hypothetical protein